MLTKQDFDLIEDWPWEALDRLDTNAETEKVLRFEQEVWAETIKQGNTLSILYPSFDSSRNTKIYIPFDRWQDAEKFFKEFQSSILTYYDNRSLMKIYKEETRTSIDDPNNDGTPRYIVELSLLKDIWEEFLKSNFNSDYFNWNLGVSYEN